MKIHCVGTLKHTNPKTNLEDSTKGFIVVVHLCLKEPTSASSHALVDATPKEREHPRRHLSSTSCRSVTIDRMTTETAQHMIFSTRVRVKPPANTNQLLPKDHRFHTALRQQDLILPRLTWHGEETHYKTHWVFLKEASKKNCGRQTDRQETRTSTRPLQSAPYSEPSHSH